MNAKHFRLSQHVTTRRAAEMLGLQPVTIKKYCQHGILSAEKIGRDWLVPLSEVRRYKKHRDSK